MPVLPAQARSQRWNSDSKANGALMRVAPLAVWGHRLPAATLAEHAALDASLSHPNPTCGEASAAYAIALAHLIAHPGDATGALAAACSWAEAHAGAPGAAGLACMATTGSEAAPLASAPLPASAIQQDQCLPASECCSRSRSPAGEEVREWLLSGSKQPLEGIHCLELAGFVQHAFTLAFHHLRQQTQFADGIEQTICRGGTAGRACSRACEEALAACAAQAGLPSLLTLFFLPFFPPSLPFLPAGDTDTNAAIVGGMLGALWGAAAIPDWMSGPVLAYEGRQEQGGGFPRPPELRAAVLPGLAARLFEAATAEG